MLELKNVVKKYSNGYLAVDDVSFCVKEGECLGIVGESGSGKSSVAKCILGLEKISSGQIILDDKIIHNKKHLNSKGSKKIQVVFQNPSLALNPKMKIIDSLLEPLKYQTWIEPSFLKGIRDDRVKVAEYLLDLVKLSKECLYKYPKELSGGQLQRITIARAISVEPHLLILDEPTASLDVSNQALVLNLLKDLQENLGFSYVFISHDLSAVNFMCDRILVMQNAKIVDSFEKKKLFEQNRNEYTKQLLEVFVS